MIVVLSISPRKDLKREVHTFIMNNFAPELMFGCEDIISRNVTTKMGTSKKVKAIKSGIFSYIKKHGTLFMDIIKQTEHIRRGSNTDDDIFSFTMSLITYNEYYDDFIVPDGKEGEEYHIYTSPEIPITYETLESIIKKKGWKKRQDVFKIYIEDILKYHTTLVEKKLFSSTLRDISEEEYLTEYLTEGEKGVLRA